MIIFRVLQSLQSVVLLAVVVSSVSVVSFMKKLVVFSRCSSRMSSVILWLILSTLVERLWLLWMSCMHWKGRERLCMVLEVKYLELIKVPADFHEVNNLNWILWYPLYYAKNENYADMFVWEESSFPCNDLIFQSPLDFTGISPKSLYPVIYQWKNRKSVINWQFLNSYDNWNNANMLIIFLPIRMNKFSCFKL